MRDMISIAFTIFCDKQYMWDEMLYLMKVLLDPLDNRSPLDSLQEVIHVELPFSTLSLPVIPWLDEIKTIEHTLDTGTFEPTPSQQNPEDANIVSNSSYLPDKSDKDTVAAEPFSTNTTSVAPAQQKKKKKSLPAWRLSQPWIIKKLIKDERAMSNLTF